MYLKFGFHIFSKNTVANIILIIQLTASIILMNIALSLYNSAYSKLDVLSGFGLDNTVYQCYIMKGFDQFETLDAYEKQLSLSDNVIIEPIMLGGVYDGDIWSFENNQVLCIAYGNNTSNLMSVPLTSGVWFSDYDKNNGYVEVIALENTGYNIGETYTMTSLKLKINYSDYTQEELGKLDWNDRYKEKEITFKIVGLIAQNTPFIAGSGSNNVDVQSMITVSEESLKDYDVKSIFLFNYDDENMEENLYFGSSVFAYTKDNTPISKKDISKMESYGFTYTIRDIFNNSKETLGEELHFITPIAISILLIGIIGILCIVILNTLKCRKTFAIYYLCGMNWKDCIKIIMCHILCIFIGSVFLVGIAFGVMTMFNLFYEVNMLVKWNNLFLTLGLLAIIFIVSIVTTKCMLSNTSPVTDLKRE